MWCEGRGVCRWGGGGWGVGRRVHGTGWRVLCLGFGVLHKADRKAPLDANADCVYVCVCARMCHCACNCSASPTLLPMHARDPLFCLDLGIFAFSGQVVIFFFPERNLLFTIGNLDTNRYVLCRSSSPPRTRSASSMMHASRLPGVFCVCDTVRRCGSIIIIFVIMLQIRSFASSRF